MNLDQHHIKIRQRGYVDLADLTLRVISRHFVPLTLAMVAGVTPFFLLNAWLFRDMLAFTPNIWGDQSMDLTLFIFWISCLTLLEAPLATIWVTHYLGHWAFNDKPDAMQMFESTVETFPQTLLFCVLLRPLLFLYPFAPEVIVLERTPWRVKNGQGVSTLKRLKALHWGEKGELFGHRLLHLVLACVFVPAIMATITGVYMLITISTSMPSFLIPWLMPIVIWGVVGFFTVMRFLAYLNLRVRHEGWDVELAMRVERAKMTESLR